MPENHDGCRVHVPRVLFAQTQVTSGNARFLKSKGEESGRNLRGGDIKSVAYKTLLVLLTGASGPDTREFHGV